MNSAQGIDHNRPLRGGALATVILVVALWGGNAVAVSFSVDVVPPIAVAAVRFSMATVMMLLWCKLEGVSLRPSQPETKVSLITGFLLFAQISTFNVGVLMSNSSHGVMLINTFIFWVSAIEHFLADGERFTARRFTGLTIAALGVVAVLLSHTSAGPLSQKMLFGDCVLLVSALLLAIRIVYVRRVVQRMTPSKLILWQDIFGVLMFAAWSLCTESLQGVRLTTPAVLGLLYQGVIVAGFCFALHAILLRRHSATQISVFSFATPVFGVMFSVALRGEPLTPSIAAGAVGVALGIWVTTSPGQRIRGRTVDNDRE